MDKGNKRGVRYRGLSRIIAQGLIACCFIVMVVSAPSGAEIVDRIVANVNGKIILYSELRSKMITYENMRKSGAMSGSGKLTEKNVLQSIIDEKVIANYATEKEVKVKEGEIDRRIGEILENNQMKIKALEEVLKRDGVSMEKYREQLKNQLLIQKITQFEVPKTNVSEEEASRYYNQNKELFYKAGKARASHIIMLTSDKSEPAYVAEVVAKLEKIKAEIEAGADFGEMAKKYSQDGASQKGGDLGWFKKGDMVPEFEQVVFTQEIGVVGGPIKTPFGHHLILVTEREDDVLLEYKKFKTKIQGQLSGQLYEEKRRAFLDRLREQAYVEILY